MASPDQPGPRPAARAGGAMGRRLRRTGDAPRHTAPAGSWAERLRVFGRSGAGALAVAGAVLVLGLIGAVFSATTSNPPNVYTADQLNAYIPTAATASRTAATTCLVSWTPVGSPPSGMTYDVTDGSGTTVATGVSGTSTSITVPTTAVTPTVKARLGSWVSSSATATSAPCNGFPDAPVVTLTPSDGAVAASWTAPAGNGGTVASYTATISPAPGSGSATCTTTAPTAACSWSSLTNGLTYTVSVTATSNVGTGPAGTATTVPYPSTVMTPSALKLWLDGADPATILASSACTGATATTAVGCWKDKSSSANNATQATGGNQPGLVTVASRSVPSFDGSTSYLGLTPGLLPNATSSSTTLAAIQMTDATPASTGFRTVVSWGTGATAQTRSYQKMSGSAAVGPVTWSGSASTGGSLTTGTTAVLSDAWSATGFTGYLNGVAGTTAAWSGTTGTTAATVGAQINATGFWKGPIPEIVVLSGTVSAADRHTVEEYLSRKWSVTITPGQPTGVTATPSTTADGTASVTWTAPAYNGGSAITSYTVTGTPADGTLPTVTQSCASSPCTVTGFTDGALYSATVTANNAVGAGPASSGVSLTTYPASVMSTANLKVWLDGADSTTLFASNTCTGAAPTTSIGCWLDKSSGGHDATGSSTSLRPAPTTVNGRSAPLFDGVDDYLGIGNLSTLPAGTSSSTTLLAATMTDPAPASSGYRTALFWGEAASAQGRQFSKTTSSAAAVVDGYGTGTTSPGTWTSSVGILAGEHTSTLVSGWMNGAPATTSAATSLNTITTRANVGRQSSANGYYWQGAVPEVVVLNGTLTSAQRRTVEEYLARKWGGVITPSAPTAVLATASTTTDGAASVLWTTPAWNGGAAVTGYTVTAVPSDGTLSTVTQSCLSSPCTVTGLTNGATYTVSVTATNSVGIGPSSGTATVIPYPAGTVMTTSALKLWLDGADTSTMFQSSTCTGTAASSVGQTLGCWTDKSGQADNAVQATASNRPTLATVNGRPVPGFDGTNDNLPLTVSKLPTGTTSSTTALVAQLTGTPGYRNLLSWGALSSGQARAQYLDSGPVKADTYLAATPAASTGSISQNQLFQAAFGYTSTSSSVTLNAGSTVSSSGSVSTGATFAYFGGAPGMTYWWQGPIPEVVVLNTALTTGQQRTLDEYLARKWGNVTVPNPPTGVTATASTTTDGAADVSWTAPTWNGGATITAYSVTATPADGTAATVTKSCASSPCTVTGLTNGATYTVTVQAVNSAGSSAAATAASTAIPYPAATFASNTLGLWLDGADSSTLLASSACTGAGATTKVGCWKDKSSNANNATQATAASQPGLATVAGRQVPSFDGSATRLTLSAALLPNGTSAGTEFGVASTTEASPASSDYRIILGYGTSATGQARELGKYTLSTSGYADTWSSGTVTAGTWVTGTPNVLTAEFAAGQVKVAAAGASYGTPTSYAFTTGTGAAAIGSNLNTANYWLGPITEVVVLNKSMSAADQRTVAEYLSRKWSFSITPSPPTGVTVTGADSQASVAWTTPWNGYSAITGYTVTATPVDGSLSTITKACASSPCTVTGMTNGATYSFVVTATNAIGTGPGSTAVSASAYPAALFTSADLRVWLDAQYSPALSAASDCSGSGATTGTAIGCWKDRSGNGWDAPKVTTNGATLTAAAINNRQALRFTKTDPDVYQATASGLGAVGSADRSVFAVAAARTTYGTTGSSNAGAVAMFNSGWNTGIFAKAYSGSTTTVDGYQVDGYNSSIVGAYGSLSATTSPTVVSAISSSSGGTLTDALSLNGTGTASSGSVAGTWQTVGNSFVVGGTDVVASNAYAYPLDGDVGEVLVFDRALTASERRTVEEYLARHWGQTIAPSAPTLSTVTKPFSGQLTASWSAPTGWNGGAAVTSYTATATASGQTTKTCSTASTSCTITGLTGGVTYTVTVAAVNSVGSGANSNALTGTP